ncbi:hypothetical protein HYT33_04215 [Candidatus Roizmanbacteria bacterium]|nr:hypothetical protein [Candidatus Roizmanbacteria bacterium]
MAVETLPVPYQGRILFTERESIIHKIPTRLVGPFCLAGANLMEKVSKSKRTRSAIARLLSNRGITGMDIVRTLVKDEEARCRMEDWLDGLPQKSQIEFVMVIAGPVLRKVKSEM